MSVVPFSLANIQGDILFGLPKQTEKFFFFKVDEKDGFRSNLANLVPLITTAEQTKGNISEIRRVKIQSGLAPDEGDGETVHPNVITVAGVNIAFSATGLNQIGFSERLNDFFFDRGMREDAEGLGDRGARDASGKFQPEWDGTFLQQIHGVALVAGDSHESVDEKLESVKSIFSNTVTEIATISGDVRPDDQKGHEHFGYKDGISNPAVEGADTVKHKGQSVIDQGIALLGRGVDANINRPSWALDGSFMAFRKLPQLVPEFNRFLLDSAGSQEGADLMGARFVGRWKSGAPLMTTPTIDDKDLGDDPERNNDFTFREKNQTACPFHAHIRKMNPRGDLPENSISQHLILRRGIPFGPEVSTAERESSTTSQERGLLFVCYQSSIGNGFSFLQAAWANSESFPFGSSPTPGFDPIIGQTNSGGVRNVTGAFANDTDRKLSLLKQWVNSRGGEYFFSPSVPTLRDVFATS